MSWSVYATGKPSVLLGALKKSFDTAREQTKNIPHEYQSVTNVQTIVEDNLLFLDDSVPYKVEAAGSAYKYPQGTAYTQIKLTVEAVPGWVEA